MLYIKLRTVFILHMFVSIFFSILRFCNKIVLFFILLFHEFLLFLCEWKTDIHEYFIMLNICWLKNIFFYFIKEMFCFAQTVGGFIMVTTLTGLIVFCSRSIEDYLGYQNVSICSRIFAYCQLIFYIILYKELSKCLK